MSRNDRTIVAVLIAIVVGAVMVTTRRKPEPSTFAVVNKTASKASVFVSFSPNSEVKAEAWSKFCHVTSSLNCDFDLDKGAIQELPAGRDYLNATVAFNGQGCGATKAELNANNPNWYDTYDVSLVDGYSNKVAIELFSPGKAPVTLGPPLGKEGNEKVYGLFPIGCDICTGRKNPPCGISPGGTGCKAGTQYNPSVPCQYQGAVMGGGGLSVAVTLMP